MGKRKQKSTLTSRQWSLYNFLKDNYEDGLYISKRTICDNLSEYYQIKENETRTCRTIEADIREINNSDLIQKIIVSNKKGYKIGNEKECAKYLYKRWERDLASIALNRKLSEKVGLDNQMRLTFGKGYERDYVETFIRKES